MIYVSVGDDVYTATDHALRRIDERTVTEGYIEATLNEPDDTQEQVNGRTRYEKWFDDRAKWLIVIADDAIRTIWTVFWK